LRNLKTNARGQTALTEEVKVAVRTRSIALGRALVSEKTSLDLTKLETVLN